MNKTIVTIVVASILTFSLIGCNQAKPTTNYEKIDKLKAQATAQKREKLDKVQKEADDLQTKWAESLNKANSLKDKALTDDKARQEAERLNSEANRYYSQYQKKEKEVNQLEQDIQQIEMKIEADNK